MEPAYYREHRRSRPRGARPKPRREDYRCSIPTLGAPTLRTAAGRFAEGRSRIALPAAWNPAPLSDALSLSDLPAAGPRAFRIRRRCALLASRFYGWKGAPEGSQPDLSGRFNRSLGG